MFAAVVDGMNDGSAIVELLCGVSRMRVAVVPDMCLGFREVKTSADMGGGCGQRGIGLRKKHLRHPC